MYSEPIKRFISGKYTAEDEQYVKQWIGGDSEKEKELQELKTVWEKTGRLQLVDDEDIDDAWRSFESILEKRPKEFTPTPIQYLDHAKRKRNSNWNLFFKIAAVLIIGFGLFSVIKYQQFPVKENQAGESMAYHIVSAPMGEHEQIILQDATKITLNAGSKVRYSEAYGRNNRTVYLTGEAYFEVNNKGQSSPFIVKTDNASIKDISTEFSIKAYKEDKSTNVVVSQGRVEVAAIKDSSVSDNQVMVMEGKMVNVSNPDVALTVESADLNEALAWLDGKLVFENKSFREITRVLERFYAVNITVHDTVLNSKKMTASFKDEKLDKVLTILALSLGAEYEIDGNRISFRKKD